MRLFFHAAAVAAAKDCSQASVVCPAAAPLKLTADFACLADCTIAECCGNSCVTAKAAGLACGSGKTDNPYFDETQLCVGDCTPEQCCTCPTSGDHMIDPPQICESDNCQGAGGGTVLPLFGAGEQEWPNGLRIVLYLLGLAWCFMGVALISDVFMAAIETITSQETTVELCVAGTDEKRKFRVRLWNDTVANLTLMALGSSAPEILLSCIELISNNFYAGALGPSTIVGSASFNLLGITAVCVMAIPKGESRIVEGKAVFAITSISSIFAYFWLLIILVFVSPNRVEIWEGFLTFIMFPVLVIMAFAADRGWLASQRAALTKLVYAEDDAGHTADDLTVDKLRRLIAEFNAKQEPVPHDLMVKLDAKTKTAKPGTKSKALRRIEATRQALRKGLVPSSSGEVMRVTSKDEESPPDALAFEFERTVYEIMENAGKVVLTVKRTHLEQQATIDYCTEDGLGPDAATAASKDYEPTAGSLVFEPGVESLTVTVGIIDDDQQTNDKNFLVKLSNPRTLPEMPCKISANGQATVLILNDDFAGGFQWSADEYRARSETGEVKLKVSRRNGCSGIVGCTVAVRDGTMAKPGVLGKDYLELQQDKLEFQHNETEKEVIVLLNKDRQISNGRAIFHVDLTAPYGGATLMGYDDNIEKLTCDVIIDESEDKTDSKLHLLTQVLQVPTDFHKLAAGTFVEQMQQALYCNGSAEAQRDSSPIDWVLHLVNLPWKILFAVVPPTKYCGGWLTFCFSLMMIGIVTAIVGDMAGLLGCVIGMPDEITAITLVALGTSLPDTFASKTAAMQDPNADASIGNVTGSNSVNVFLGLGLPWFIGAIYWSNNWETELDEWLTHRVGKKTYAEEYLGKYPDGGFMVPAGSLAFSVAVFTTCAVLCIALLLLRRAFCGGELGGPSPQREVSAGIMLSLWLIYISLSSWNTLASKD
eukprot:CAMPEP_0204309868 /NCGR_PEP_ID=MMETSP0469-20131031/1363_1 /ASSEMBLY_ACC=CAM_ASM_000384 /TAXON_ID=2969 /ORGANISM="Oxyrrhis marina" /LENGTH=934 /DNA_ID=CAMNT_0051289551 /DNA_START=25 /DNA_END=2829 /DNA_ORIENTATION=-